MVLRLSKQKFTWIIISTFLVGLIVNWILIGSPTNPIKRAQTFFYILFIPISTLMYLSFLHLTKIKNKIVVVISNIVWFVIALMFSLFLLDASVGGSLSGEFGVAGNLLMFYFSVIPVAIIGLLLGLWIAFSLDK